MGIFHPPPYRKLNRETGMFEWVYPEAIEYTDDKGSLKPIKVERDKSKQKKYKKRK